MNKIAHFFTDNKYISYLEYMSIYSFWLQHRDWQYRIYNNVDIIEPKNGNINYYSHFLSIGVSLYDVNFNIVKVNNKLIHEGATREEKDLFLKEYILNNLKIGGYWLSGNRIYLDKIDKNEGLLIDKKLDINEGSELNITRSTDKALSIFKKSFIIDCINYYSRKGKILDVGCGDKGLTKNIKNRKITTVDAWEPFKPDLLWDLNNTPLPYKNNSFDTVLMIDLIEHLSKENGLKLLKEVKRIAKKRIFLLTPLCWHDNHEESENPESSYFKNEYNKHKSLWSLEDFKDWTRLTDQDYLSKYFFGIWEKK